MWIMSATRNGPATFDYAEARLVRLIVQRRVQQLADRPRMVCQPERHRGRHARGFVHAAPIVMPDEQAKSGRVVFEFFAEGVCQSRKATARHSQRQIAPLDIARRNVRWLAGNNPPIYCYYGAGRIPASGIDGWLAYIRLDDLAVGDALPKTVPYGWLIPYQTVRRDFRCANDSLAKVNHDGFGIVAVPLADAVGKDCF